ncbi:MAG: hypothetical protein ACXWUG_07640 [Polyangiales bacterium]
MHGEHRRCPGCGAKAEVISKGGMLFVCAACGRPRVPMEQSGIPRSGREREALARAEADLRDGMLATVLGIIAFVIATFLLTGALFSVLLGFGLLSVIFFVLTAVLGGAGGFAFMRKGGARKRAEEAMQDAFGAVALDVLRARGPTTSGALAQILGVPEPVADRALTRLPARTDVRVDTVIDDRAADGMVRYRISEDATLPADSAVLQDAASASFDERLKAAMRQKGQS